MRDSTSGRPPASPVEPVELTAQSRFQFDCHPGIACFNACCKNIDITLTPYDIIRLKQRLGMSAGEFVAAHTLPFEMDAHGMPGLKLLTKRGTSECRFLAEQGCSVYEDRPAACRYYALGCMGIRKKDGNTVEDIYFVVKEAHCLGHGEQKSQSVAEYRAAQGADKYDEMNRPWRDIVIKKRSSGPTVGAPTERSLQLFDMCSYDMDSFKQFVRGDGFRTLFALDDAAIDALCGDEERLLAFSMRFLRQVLFGEHSIPLEEGARERRISERKPIWDERRAADLRRHRESQDAQKVDA